MVEMHPEYIVDDKQNTKAVVLPFKEWQKVLEALEELDDIKAYDDVKSQPSELISFEQAIDEIK